MTDNQGPEPTLATLLDQLIAHVEWQRADIIRKQFGVQPVGDYGKDADKIADLRADILARFGGAPTPKYKSPDRGKCNWVEVDGGSTKQCTYCGDHDLGFDPDDYPIN